MSALLQFPEVPGNKSSIALEYFATSDSVVCEIKANDIDQIAAMYGVLSQQLMRLGYLSEPQIYQIIGIAAEEETTIQTTLINQE